MNLRNISLPWAGIRWVVVVAVIAIGASTYRTWQPRLQGWVQTTAASFRGGSAGHGPAETEAAAPSAEGEHASHSADSSVELSKQAMQNLGLTEQYLRPIARSTFRRSIRVPAIVVEKPGVTRTQVATPMTAIVTQIHVVSGQQVQPGQLLFSLRLTHEDLVNSQTEFLKLLGEVDVEKRELARLSQVSDGAIPPKLILDRQYAVQRLQAQIDAQREALKLHGLNDELVGRIESDRKLLRTLELYAPVPGETGKSEFRLTETKIQSVSYESDPAPADVIAEAPILVLEELRVHPGQAVTAGDTLCVLANYRSLYVEGQAFEKDADSILAARERGWPVTAIFEGSSAESTIPDLPIAFVANAVDVESRSMHFYVELPNRVLPQAGASPTSQFVTWKYRPGQRLDLSVPVEEWQDQIVLPVDSVARDGAESYVFLQNGGQFTRKAVHVKHRDQQWVVVANDGTLFPGDVVARRGAYQLQMALKNKSGGGVDPHAGHTH